MTIFRRLLAASLMVALAPVPVFATEWEPKAFTPYAFMIAPPGAAALIRAGATAVAVPIWPIGDGVSPGSQCPLGL